MRSPFLSRGSFLSFFLNAVQYSPGNRLLLVVYVFDALVGFYAIINFFGSDEEEGREKESPSLVAAHLVDVSR